MAVDYFLKLATIPGEAVADKHSGEIQVSSWSWGGSQTSSVSATAGSGAGKVSLSDLNMTIEFDKSSPKLLQGLTKGQHFATALLSGVKAGAGNANYFTMALTEAFIASLQYSASGDIPMVSLSLTYKSFQMDYYSQDAEGTVTNAGTAKYDVTTNVTS
ncbi:MAG: Hcp family type VI secretion system effector [Janthinobacterium lividum]